jgi:predicted nucleic acid-binding protein
VRARPPGARAHGTKTGEATIFVDSSAWIAFFSASDGRHREADEGFRRAYAQRSRLFTSTLVLAEVHRLLLFRAGIRPARFALERIVSGQQLTVIYPIEKHDVAARDWLDRFADRAVSYTDATSFALMRDLRCRFAFSFDEDFELAGFRLWSGAS